VIDKFDGEYRFLSNFWPAPVTAMWGEGGTTERVLVPTVEHAYQAMKCMNRSEFDAICAAPTPGIAKRLGRKVTLRPLWANEEFRLATMHGLLNEKFAYGSDLAEKLLATGDVELVEGNWWGDTYWGVCRGVGKNALGRLLMEVRKRLRLAARP
jgi:N-glycosidase YbiA